VCVCVRGRMDIIRVEVGAHYTHGDPQRPGGGSLCGGPAAADERPLRQRER
jgi:hypothetical protein